MYDIPWPPQFMSFISTLRLFLIDVVSITKASCAQPMNYYDSMMLVLVGMQIVLLLLLLGPWVWGKISASQLNIVRRWQQRKVRSQVRPVNLMTQLVSASSCRRRCCAATALLARFPNWRTK